MNFVLLAVAIHCLLAERQSTEMADIVDIVLSHSVLQLGKQQGVIDCGQYYFSFFFIQFGDEGLEYFLFVFENELKRQYFLQLYSYIGHLFRELRQLQGFGEDNLGFIIDFLQFLYDFFIADDALYFISHLLELMTKIINSAILFMKDLLLFIEGVIYILIGLCQFLQHPVFVFFVFYFYDLLSLLYFLYIFVHAVDFLQKGISATVHFAESLFYLFNPSFVGMRKLAQRVNGSMMGTHNTALVTDWLIASITEETEGEFVLTTLQLLHIQCINIDLRQIMADCIFEKSRFYKKAVTSPPKQIEAIGYSFLVRSKNTNIELIRTGELIRKYVTDRQVYKFIAGKKTLPQKLQQFFQITQLQRKSHYLSSSISDFLQKQIDANILNALISQFMPNVSEDFGIVELAQLISNPGIDSIYHIEDFALTSFCFIYEGTNVGKLEYLYEFFNRRIIQYPVETIHIKRNVKSTKLNENSKVRGYAQVKVEEKERIRQQISLINSQNRERDLNYNGVHFYYGDCIMEENRKLNILDREIEHTKLLQYYVLMITGLLGEGQSAVIKLNGCFRQKTCEYIFLLKLAFNGKFTLVKPYGANPYNLQCYLVCEHYNSQNGQKVHEYIFNNFELLFDYGEDKLLLNSKKIFREGIFDSIKLFNDSMMKNIQMVIREFKNNPDIEYYPNKAKLLEKIPTKFCKYDEVVEVVDSTLPREQSFVEDEKKKRKEESSNKIIEKEGKTELLDFFTTSFLSENKEKKKEQKREEKKDKSKVNESVENILNELHKTKKKQERKKKSNKKNDI